MLSRIQDIILHWKSKKHFLQVKKKLLFLKKSISFGALITVIILTNIELISYLMQKHEGLFHANELEVSRRRKRYFKMRINTWLLILMQYLYL